MVKLLLHIIVISCCFYIAQAQEICIATGAASYYANKFEGRRTANGERFRQSEMTCAHRTLPFGTKLRVTNLQNNKTIIVRVNDRGPYVKGRIIDLSFKAAKALDFVKNGHAKVKIELNNQVIEGTTYILAEAKPSFNDFIHLDSINAYTIKLGIYNEDKMLSAVEQIKAELDCEPLVQKMDDTSNAYYSICVGEFYRKEDAEGLLSQIKSYYPNSYILELEAAKPH